MHSGGRVDDEDFCFRADIVILGVLLASGTALAAGLATQGPDVISDTPSGDVLRGLGGNDSISGLGGRDVLSGDAGGDVIFGGRGADTIYGDNEVASGSDVISGGGGDDFMDGGRGADNVSGGAGDDFVIVDGGAEKDVVSCRPGFDRYYVRLGDRGARVSPDCEMESPVATP